MEQFAKIVNDTKLLVASGLYTKVRQARNNVDTFYFQNRKNTISNVGVVEVMLWKKMN